MPLWSRVSHEGREWFGTIEGDTIVLHEGDMFTNPRATGESIPRSAAKLLTPTKPSKMIGLVDNYHALVSKLDHPVPAEPLYFLKGGTSFLAGDEAIRTPQFYEGKVVFEGELGIVIGKRCRAVAQADAHRHMDDDHIGVQPTCRLGHRAVGRPGRDAARTADRGIQPGRCAGPDRARAADRQLRRA